MRKAVMMKFRSDLSATTARGAMSDVERRIGRMLRAPDGHADSGGGGANAGVAEAAAAPAAGEGAGAAGAAGSDGDDGTALGGAAAGEPEPAGDPDGEGAGDGEGADGDAASGPPDTYDLTIEGGEALDAALVTEADPLLRALNLSNDQAKSLVPMALKIRDQTAEATLSEIVSQGNQQRKAWLDEARAAEDIGGASWDGALHVAAKGLDALGYGEGHPFREALNATGFGNHPDMIRTFKRLGELVGEDGEFLRGEASAPRSKDVAKRLYPDD